jgi:hypothetical protein
VSKQYELCPAELFNRFKKELREYLSENPSLRDDINGIMQAICDQFSLKIIVYALNDHHIFNPTDPAAEKCMVAQLYWDGVSFDGVLNAACQVPRYILPRGDSPNYAHGIKICSWNLSGATSDEKRVAIDFELFRDKISLAGVQETHLRSHKLRTMHYTWILGPQYQERASRGLGFIIENRLLSYMLSITFPTPNIGCLIFKLPNMKFPCVYVNIHKHNDGTVESSLETGIKVDWELKN